MKIFSAFLSGFVAFIATGVMAIVISYIRCMAAGMPYNLGIAIPIAVKAGAFVGGVIFLLSLIGSPRRFPPN
jgi:hypothetical protein